MCIRDRGNGLKMVIGMSLAYVTSFAGLLLAYYSYRKHRRERGDGDESQVARGDTGPGPKFRGGNGRRR